MRTLSKIGRTHVYGENRRKGTVGRLAKASFVLWLLHTVGGTAASSTTAQRSFALEVNVVDDRGVAIPGATVRLQGSRLWEGRPVTTQTEGRFTFTGLGSGGYRIVVSAANFVPSAWEDLLIAGETVRIVLLRRSAVEKRPIEPEVSLSDLAAPPDAQAKYREGLARQREGRHQEARSEFSAAIEIYPKYAAAYAGLGISLLQLGAREEALRALQHALELDPSSYDGHVSTGLILNDLKKFAEARDYLVAAERLNLRNWRVHYELGRTYYGLSQFAEAEKSLQLARRSRPRYGNLYLLLANTLALEGKYAEAITAFEEFLEVAPSNPAVGEVRKKLALLRAEVKKLKSPGD